jgi:hypothetical protein
MKRGLPPPTAGLKKIARQAASIDADAQENTAAIALSSSHAFSKAIDPQKAPWAKGGN